MTLPVVFIMLSNHFPGTYGHAENWLILILLMIAGASIRHLFNTPGRLSRWAVAASVIAVAAFLWVSAGTGADDAEEVPAQTAEAGSEEDAGKAIDPETSGAIRGVMKWTGEVPAPREALLKSGCGEGRTTIQPVQVSDGRLQDVYVWVKEGLDGWAVDPAPDEPVDIDQKNCIYLPRVTGVRAGQEVRFLNSDPIMHNVNIRTVKKRNYNMNMSAGAKPKSRRFRRAQAMITARCDVHPWMSGFVGVSDHPFFAVTGEDGSFSFEGLPPGDYVIEAWHEVGGRQTQKLTLGPRDRSAMAFEFSAP